MNQQYDYMFQSPLDSLGCVTSTTWFKDPKRLSFVLSRYKFCAKMLEGCSNVLEIGCGDGWASKIVSQHVNHLTLSDYDNRFCNHAAKITQSWPDKPDIVCNDFIHNPLPCSFDGAYMLDVFEHIPHSQQHLFISNVVSSLLPSSPLIIGIPSIESQSLIPQTQRDPGHVNCQSKHQLRTSLLPHVSRVFMFSMNDELVHTGHGSMSHYLLALCIK